MFPWLGKIVSRHWLLIICAWGVALVLLHRSAPVWDEITQDGDFAYLPPEMPSVVGEQLLTRGFPRNRAKSQIAFFVIREEETLDHDDLIPEARGLELAAFIAGGDALRALDALGPEYGVEISRDGLRRLARLLLRDQAPVAFTPLPLEVDPALRELFQPRRSPVWEERSSGPGTFLLGWLIAAAQAEPSPADTLRGVVPRLETLDDYLETVSLLLGQEARARLGAESRVPPVFRHLIDPLVRATAWKESCWRQYTGPSSNPRVLTSSVGAVGMMQIHTRVWRGVYDTERLADDVQYNVRAGIEILEYYLVDYAIRREEHRQPGGLDNLVRATYAAYNGGPSHLTRYRRDDVATSLRIIDREFWRHYQIMRETRWPDVGSCYPVGG